MQRPLIVSFLLVLLFPCLVNGNDFAEVGLPISHHYSQDEYNAHHTNWDIQQAENGLVYMANGNSLLEYDGEKFTRYSSPNNTASREIEIIGDRIYAGTLNTIGYYQADEKGILQYHSLNKFIDKKYLPFGEVYSAKKIDNKIVFKGLGHFFIWDGKSVRTIVDGSKSYVKINTIGTHHYIKLLNDETVYQIDANADNILSATKWRLPKKAQIKKIITAKNGDVVFFTAHLGIFVQKKDGLQAIENILDGDEFIYDAILSRDGYYYVATINAGLFILSQDFTLLKNYRDIHGLKLNQVTGVMQDKQNNIWTIGNGGITIMRPPNEVSRYAQDNNMYAFNFVSIQNTPSFVGKRIQQLQHNKQNRLFPPAFSAIGDLEGVKDAIDYKDKAIVCTNNGLYLLKIEDQKIIEQERIFNQSNYVFDIARTDDYQHIFISTHIGVFHIQYINESWKAQMVKGLNFEVNNIEIEDNRVLWVGTRTSQLYRLQIAGVNTDKQNLIEFGKADGLGDNLVIPFKLKQGVVFGMNDGTMYYSEKDKKLHHVDKLPKIFNTKDQAVEFIYQDADDNIWFQIGDYKGVAKKDNQQWTANDKIFSYFPERFNSNYISLKPNVLWFMQTGGEIYRMDVQLAEKTPTIAPLYIRKVFDGNNDSIIQTGQLQRLKNELNFDSNSIRVHFALVDFATPDKAVYRTKLIGSQNPKWSKWSKETYRDFTELRGNNYSLAVQAKDGFGRITKSTTLDFTVLPPFYLSKTALIIYGLLALTILTLTAWLVQKWRTKKLQAHNRELAALVDKKTIEIQGHVEELEQQQDLKTRFFTNISHELRTPLSLIILPLQKLIRTKKNNLDTESKDLVTLSLKNAEGMKQLVSQVLDVSRFEEKTMPIMAEENDFYGFVENLLPQFVEWAEENQQKITLIEPDEKILLYFDRQIMEKIISNVLSNAIKYSGKGSSITLSFFKNTESSGIVIKDDGIGIEKEQCQQVFERYFKANQENSRYDSSGIGLSFVKEMIELHQATIELHSDSGCGCEFVLTFKNGDKHFSRIQHKNHNDKHQIHGKNDQAHPDDTSVVMVVEDNTDLRSFISQALATDYKVIQAINGADALNTLEHELPDLIISDIMMPQMDGIEFLQNLREIEQFKTVPFFLLSSKSRPIDTQLGLQYGANDYLTKPFDMDELMLRVKNMINARRLIRKQVQDELNQIKQSHKQDHTKALSPFEEKLREIIINNISDSHFNVSELASEFGLDRSALFRKVKKELNTSPSKYIHKTRLEIAKELLDKGSITVSEIAYASGFESLSYFSKSFKIHYGHSPSES